MKCYTIHESIVYIYATGGDTLIDVGTIPDGLGVFCVDVPWRLSPRVAVSEGVTEEGIKALGMLLSDEGYSRVDSGASALEDYFVSGVEPMIPMVTTVPIKATPSLHQWTHNDRPIAQARVSLMRMSRRRRVSKPAPLPRAK